MASVEERLNTAAVNGSIDTLYNVIRDDPNVLDNIDVRPFVDTPLHIAASSGTIEFAMEMMRLKPSFARKFNQDGFTSLHLAIQNNKYKMAWRLVEANNDLVRIQGRSGETALHLAARNGNTLNLLKTFLRVCPDSIQDVTIKRQTALHIAPMNSNIGAFDHLVAELLYSVRKNSGWLELEILHKADANEDTLLHIAVRINRPKVVRKLLRCGAANRINLRNELPSQVQPEGLNHDIGFRNEIIRMLSAANDINLLLRLLMPTRTTIQRIRKNVPSDVINMILVVLALIVTATYQVALTPPSGLWQDDNNGRTRNGTANHRAETAILGQTMNGTANPKAETAILGEDSKFVVFHIINTFTFFLSITLISFLMSSPGNLLLLGPLYSLLVCYLLGSNLTSPDRDGTTQKFNTYGFYLVTASCVGMQTIIIFRFIFRVKKEIRPRSSF